jgi:hypothetical protein
MRRHGFSASARRSSGSSRTATPSIESDAHLVNRHEVVTTSAKIFDSYKIDADGVRRPVKVKSKPVVIKREEKIHLTKYPDELRRLLRYRREAECHRRRALKEWIAYLKRVQKSKTKPKEAAHAA